MKIDIESAPPLSRLEMTLKQLTVPLSKLLSNQLMNEPGKIVFVDESSMNPLNEPNSSYPQEERMWRNELDRAKAVLRTVSQRPILTGTLQKLQLAQVREAEAVLRAAQKRVDRYSMLRSIKTAEIFIADFTNQIAHHKKSITVLRKKLGKA